jgi:hypothetical protein
VSRCKTVLAVLLVAAMAASSTACGGRKTPDGTISTERFIEMNVALRQIVGDAPDAAERRDSVLHAYGVTEDQLRNYVDAHRADAAHLAEVWDEIRSRLQVAADSVAAIPIHPTPDTAAADTAVTTDTVHVDTTRRAVPPSGPAIRRPPATPPIPRDSVRLRP